MAKIAPSIPPSPEKKKAKLPLPVIGAVVVLLAFLYGAYSIGYRPVLKGTNVSIQKIDIGATPVLYDLGSYTTNLAGNSGNDFIRCDIVLKMRTDEQGILVGEKDVLDSTVLQTLRSQTYLQVDGNVGVVILKNLLQHNIDGLLGHKGIYNVYFTDFLVQPG